MAKMNMGSWSGTLTAGQDILPLLRDAIYDVTGIALNDKKPFLKHVCIYTDYEGETFLINGFPFKTIPLGGGRSGLSTPNDRDGACVEIRTFSAVNTPVDIVDMYFLY